MESQKRIKEKHDSPERKEKAKKFQTNKLQTLDEILDEYYEEFDLLEVDINENGFMKPI